MSSQIESSERIEVSSFVYSGLENILEENYEAALSDFNKALESDDEKIIVLAYKARLLNKMDRNSEALEIWETILKLDPDWDYAQLNKASSLVNMGENKMGILALVQIVANDPFGRYAVLAIMNQAIAEYNLENYEQAVKACELVKESGEFDNVLRLWHTWVHSLYPIEDYDLVKFEQVIQEGLKHFPDDLELTKSLCICLNWQNKFRESLTLCDKVLDEDPADVTTWLYKAQNLAELCDADKAYEAFFVAISIDRSNLKENQKEGLSKSFLKLNDDRFQKLIDSV